MLNSGLIRSSTNSFSSLVLLVRKRWNLKILHRLSGAQFGHDQDRFPIPTIDDMLNELHGAAFFAKLALIARYHQVRVHTPDVYKTAFCIYNGHYEYLVMSFGLYNTPSTFQGVMNGIFWQHLRKFVMVFFDDILIYSPSWTLHLDYVRQVFEILRQHQFFIKLKKCVFGQQELEYLGHIVTLLGVKVDQNKIQPMFDWP